MAKQIHIDKTREQFFKVSPHREEYLGQRYFRYIPESEKVVQVCISIGEVKKGKSNTFGIYLINRITLFSNYLVFGWAIPCEKKEYQEKFEETLKMLR